MGDRYTCEVCGSFFTTKNALGVHRKIKHGLAGESGDEHRMAVKVLVNKLNNFRLAILKRVDDGEDVACIKRVYKKDFPAQAVKDTRLTLKKLRSSVDCPEAIDKAVGLVSRCEVSWVNDCVKVLSDLGVSINNLERFRFRKKKSKKIAS